MASTLHLSTSSNPARINPILATDAASAEIANYIFNGLVKYDKNGKKIIGDLAEKFYFEDNITLIFELKKGVKWHDGEPFSAKDVLFTYELINSPQVVSPYTSTFRMVKSVEILDELTLKVTYKEPYFKALELWMSGILPYHLLKDEQNIMSADFNTDPIGTGPYRLTKLEFSKNIELSAYDDYFEHRPKIDKIVYHVIPDGNTRFLMLKTQKIDIGSLEAMQIERQVEASFFDNYKVIEEIAHAYTYLGMNLRREKFQDPRVREALSLAIDRKELVDILFMGHGQVCTGPFLPGGPAFNSSVKAPTQNVERAKELLKEAGYDETHPFSFEIATSNSSSIRPYAAQILQHQFAKVGVEVKLRVMEWQAFLNTVVFPREFDTVLLGWSLSLSPDPYLLWHSDSDRLGAFNFIGYNNEKVDSLIEKMQGTIERDELAKIQQQIFGAVVADNPYLFLFIPNAIEVVDKKIKHIEPTLNGIWHNYIEWELEE
ncbi:MAG: peptide-binding protein [Helicobacteraceae bacterium]|jgi:peptide/nickel transport system substrate-binding protein|nr:peptide-binding protein [Helicobacteraceae bacterium]